MKKFLFFWVLFFSVDAVYAACELTSHVLKSGSDATYDEYLYPDGSDAEMRQEGKNVRAYLCGYGACDVGDVVRLRNGAVGGSGTNADAVYKCDLSGAGRDNYHWVINEVESICTVSENKFRYDKNVSLWVYGNRYCAEIDEVKQLENIFNVDNSTIINNITPNYDVDITHVYDVTVKKVKLYKKLSADDLKKIKALVGKSESDIRADMQRQGIQIEGLEKDVKKLNDLIDNIANIVNDNTGNIKGLKFEIDSIESNQLVMEKIIKGLENSGLTLKAFDQVSNLINSAANDLNVDISLLSVQMNNLEKSVRKMSERINALVNDIAGLDREKTQQINNIRNDLSGLKNTTQQLEMLIQVIEQAGLNEEQLQQVKNYINDALIDLRVDISVIKSRLDSISADIAGIKADVQKLDVKLMWGNLVNSMINSAQDSDIRALGNKLQSLQNQIDAKMNEGQVISMIEGALRGASLNQTQLNAVKQMIEQSASLAHARMDIIADGLASLDGRLVVVEFDVDKLKSDLSGLKQQVNNQYEQLNRQGYESASAIRRLEAGLDDVVSKLNNTVTPDQAREMIQAAVDKTAMELDGALTNVVDAAYTNIINQMNAVLAQQVGVIENRLGKIEADVANLQKKTDDLLNQIADVSGMSMSEINIIKQQIAGLTNPADVVALIGEHTQLMRNDIKLQIANMMAEYAKQFAQMQRVEIELIINSYMDMKISGINSDIKKMQEQNIARDKVSSAMSVLNSFASGAKVSVWKNKDGKFNTARLASDATAGVVLGTAGGLISNHVIKKNQIKKGMQDIQCTVAGQVVAEYGDEFMVGMQ